MRLSSRVSVRLVADDVIREIVQKASLTPPGCIVEVGVYQGGTASFLYELAMQQQRELYLYDTFSGIPHICEYDKNLDIGDFCNTDYRGICDLFPKAGVIKGIFPDSAVAMPPVAFAHIDCDAYQSVKESAQYLAPKMVKGGIMWFDDSPSLAGALKAVTELFDGRIRECRSKHYVEF